MVWLSLRMTALILLAALDPTLSSSQPGTTARLSALVDQSTFAGFPEADVASARIALIQALAHAPLGVTADDWQYLKPEKVSRALESNSPDMSDYIDNLIAKLSQDISPYENPG